MSDSDNERLQQIADAPPAHDPSKKQIKMHQNYKRLQQKKKRNEKAENVSGSWDPTIIDCKFTKNKIACLSKEKMAKGCISSIHSCNH
jgi:hypothetical protein